MRSRERATSIAAAAFGSGALTIVFTTPQIIVLSQKSPEPETEQEPMASIRTVVSYECDFPGCLNFALFEDGLSLLQMKAAISAVKPIPVLDTIHVLDKNEMFNSA